MIVFKLNAQMAYMAPGEGMRYTMGQLIGTKLLQPPATYVRFEEDSDASIMTARLAHKVGFYCQIIQCTMLLILGPPRSGLTPQLPRAEAQLPQQQLQLAALVVAVTGGRMHELAPRLMHDSSRRGCQGLLVAVLAPHGLLHQGLALGQCCALCQVLLLAQPQLVDLRCSRAGAQCRSKQRCCKCGCCMLGQRQMMLDQQLKPSWALGRQVWMPT